MIEAVVIAAAIYLVVALLAFGALAMHPHADEFRPMRALGAALAWLPALIYVQARRIGGGADS